MRPEVAQELERIREQDNGTLNPHRVVETASDPDSPLHAEFTWDDAEAAYQHRLLQARQLIQVSVTVMGSDQAAVRTYVSLRSDRQPGVGYRHIQDVMSDQQHRAQLLDQALKELAYWRDKHSTLTELSDVFAAADEARERHGKERREAS